MITNNTLSNPQGVLGHILTGFIGFPSHKPLQYNLQGTGLQLQQLLHWQQSSTEMLRVWNHRFPATTVTKVRLFPETSHLCVLCWFAWACYHACACTCTVCFGHTVWPLFPNRSLRGTVQQAQRQKMVWGGRKRKKTAPNQDFYGNKCRWKCGSPINSPMPCYLG